MCVYIYRIDTYIYIYILCEIWGIPILTDTRLAMSLKKTIILKLQQAIQGIAPWARTQTDQSVEHDPPVPIWFTSPVD